MSIRFSDQVGDYASAEYSFRITNGADDVYADFSGSGLNVFREISESEIVSEVLMALSAGIANLNQTDSSFDMSEWDVAMSGDHLLIKNKKGRAIAIDSFSSSAGFMTATPINEPGAANILADKNAYYSETRLQINTSAFGQDFSATGTDRFSFTLDGVSNSANLTVNVNGSATNGGLVSGAQFASVIQTALQSADISVRDPNTGSAIMAADLSDITVRYDADTAELVIRDPAGRAIGFGLDASANTLCKTGIIFLDDFVTGPPNKMYTVDTNSSTAQGDVYNSTAVTLDFSTSDIGFNIQINGKYLDGESLTSGSALISSNVINWNSEQPFGSSILKTKLDSLMSNLNSVHPRDVFEYSYFGNSITIFQRDGGEIILGGYVSSDKHRTLVADITPAPSQGQATSFIFEAHTVGQNATAQGTGALYTEAVLNIEGDDIFSLQVSDGIQAYKMEPTTVDISNKRSVENFIQTLEETLASSEIKVSMDLDGNITFNRKDGGKIILQEFTSATGRQGSWNPSPGQGEVIALNGKGSIKTSNNLTIKESSSNEETTLNYSLIEGADLPLSNLSIETQKDSQSALKAIDFALDYVVCRTVKFGGNSKSVNTYY